jgi:signal transduction histidine kinase
MTDLGPSPLSAAWGSIPAAHESSARLGSFTRARVERIVEIAVGVCCVAIGGQGFVAALTQATERGAWWPYPTIVVFASLILMVVSCFIGRGARLFSGIFAVICVLALLLWPWVSVDTVAALDTQPALYFLLNVATVAAVVAFPMPLQITWTVLVPLLWGTVRLIQFRFMQAALLPVGLDVTFALILGFVLLVLTWMFRAIAVGVDEARTRAVASYAEAAGAAAVEKERLSVGALMHDSVLAALIAAERAETARTRGLAVNMSREALIRLANTERDAGMGPDIPVPVEDLVKELESAAAELGRRIVVHRDLGPMHDVRISGVVLRAIVLAATQAISNAIQHAAGMGLAVVVTVRTGPTRVRVTVSDTGGGFDPDSVSADRLGVRGSINARMAAVGGSAQISSSAHGTTVALEWAEADDA